MFRRESLVEICHYRIRDLFGGCDLDVIHVDHQHRYNLVIHHQPKHARVYQALPKTTLNQDWTTVAYTTSDHSASALSLIHI